MRNICYLLTGVLSGMMIAQGIRLFGCGIGYAFLIFGGLLLMIGGILVWTD